MSTESWHMAALALQLLAVDPAGLGGAVIRMRAGPDRDALLARLPTTTPLRKMPPSISDEQLFGGIDLPATLATARVVHGKGFFETACFAVIPMAERCTATLAAKLSSLMDQSLTAGIVALDEGAEPDEAVPATLAERLAFHIEPDGRRPDTWAKIPAAPDSPDVSVADATIQLTVLASTFGIGSLRAPTLALRAAKAHARYTGRSNLTEADIEIAAALVFPHRATIIPQEETAGDPLPPAPPEPDSPDEADGQDKSTDMTLPEGDMLIAAVKALLPPGLLDQLVSTRTSRVSSGAGAGRTRTGNRRGRPLPSRPGRLDGTARIDLVATLRAAAPWQPIRRKHQPDRPGLLIRPSDIRLKRYAEQSDRLLIFCVDASGSAAMARLGEAKGAIELLLADAYANRDHVALIAFRGTGAEILLPPTRSFGSDEAQAIRPTRRRGYTAGSRPALRDGPGRTGDWTGSDTNDHSYHRWPRQHRAGRQCQPVSGGKRCRSDGWRLACIGYFIPRVGHVESATTRITGTWENSECNLCSVAPCQCRTADRRSHSRLRRVSNGLGRDP